MNFAEFAGNHPWALTVLKSELLLRLVELLEKERSVDELVEELSPLTVEDIMRALVVLKKLGVVREDGKRYILTDLGRKFLETYRSTF